MGFVFAHQYRALQTFWVEYAMETIEASILRALRDLGPSTPQAVAAHPAVKQASAVAKLATARRLAMMLGASKISGNGDRHNPRYWL